MKRPSKDIYFMTIAHAVSLRSSCNSRSIGCVLVDNKYHILSTGYNGPASSQPHCNPCRRIESPSGVGLDNCVAVHAEQNALLQCPDIQSIYIAYVTVSPCLHCVKLLMNTSCKTIMFMEEYPVHEDLAKKLWESTGRSWYILTLPERVENAMRAMTAIRKV